MLDLSAVRALLEVRVPRSAKALLDHLQSTGACSPEAASLARAIRGALLAPPPLPEVSALTVDKRDCGIVSPRDGGIASPSDCGIASPRDCGVVLPLACELRSASAEYLGEKAREAAANSLSLARAAVGLETPVELRLVFRHQVPVDGESLGLAAALCFIARLSGNAPRRAVLATGKLAADGTVRPIDCPNAKLTAAMREVAGRDAIVLAHPFDAAKAPAGMKVYGVETLDEAVKAAFDGPLEVAAEFLRLSELLKSVRGKRPAEAIGALEAALAAFPAPADQAGLLAELGTQNRHLGRTEQAKALHDRALALLEPLGPLLGKKLEEDLRVEAIATEIDLFEIDSAEATLARMMVEPNSYADFHNLVRCRGMRAVIASMRGDFARALSLRRQNLAQQDGRDDLRAEIPRTLCPMVIDAAKAGEAAVFEDLAWKLLHQPRPDCWQERYNTDALLRGLVVLGRCSEAVRWSRGDIDLFGRPASDYHRALLCGGEPIVAHPEVSIARALIRALRRIGELDEALRLAQRVSPPATDALVAWLGCTAHVEAALVRWQLGQRTEALAELAELAGRMDALHPRASRFHSQLLDEMRCLGARLDESKLERCLDPLYY